MPRHFMVRPPVSREKSARGRTPAPIIVLCGVVAALVLFGIFVA